MLNKQVCSADVHGESFEAAIASELQKISTFYIEKEGTLTVRSRSASKRIPQPFPENILFDFSWNRKK